MKAKVKTKNGQNADVEIFGIIGKRWKIKAIIYDLNENKFKIIPFFKQKNLSSYNVIFPVENEPKDWIHNEKISGYSWFIKEKDIIKKIKRNIALSQEIDKKCIDLQQKTKIKNLFEIKNKQDIETILCFTSYFHDSYVKNFIKTNEKIEIELDTTWGNGVIFTLTNEPKTNLTLNYGNFGEILDSTMFFQDKQIFWTNNPDVKSKDDLEKDDAYFSAGKIICELLIY